MNYKDMVTKARKKTLRLALKQQREILNIYKDTVKELSKKASIAGDKTLKKRWLEDYSKHLDKTTEELENRLYKSIEGAMEQAGKHAVDADLEFFKEAIKKAGIDLGPHFTEMFSEAPNEVLAGIIKGDFYKDGKGLSDRIWNYTNDFEKDIDYIIKRAIAEKKSARELAKDLETFVKPESRRPWAWGTVYPNLRTKQVDYNAQRLARTSITHAHRESQHESARRNPFVEAIHWELSDAHYERQVSRWGEDECDEYAEQDNYGLGVGNFPKDEVPLSHPQCLCVTYGVITKTLEDVADELNNWLDGEKNQILDEWYDKYSEYFGREAKDDKKPEEYDIIKEVREYMDRLDKKPAEVKEELDKIYAEDYEKKLKFEHRNAIDEYQGAEYMSINGYLRSFIHDVKPITQKVIKHLEEAINFVETKEDMLVVRGTTVSWFGDKTWEEIEDGDILVEKGFFSTSLCRKTSLGFCRSKGERGVFAEIKVNKGTKGLFFDTAINNSWEAEFLFKPNTKIIIEEKRVDENGIKRIKGVMISE